MRTRRAPLCGLVLAVFGVVFAIPPTTSAQEVVFETTRMPNRVENLLRDEARRVRIWGLVQRVVQDVRNQNETPIDSGRVAELDRSWRAGEEDPQLVRELATNECASALQTLLGSNPGFANAFVMDRQGALVCLVTRTEGFSMARESLFRRAFGGGTGVTFVGAPREDPVLGVEVAEISVPVRDKTETIGVLTAVKILPSER